MIHVYHAMDDWDYGYLSLYCLYNYERYGDLYKRYTIETMFPTQKKDGLCQRRDNNYLVDTITKSALTQTNREI
jgi:hypothetical protein